MSTPLYEQEPGEQGRRDITERVPASAMTGMRAEAERVGAAARASGPLRVAFCLPGLHRVVRGAEVAFESVAQALADSGDYQVTLVGSGPPRPGAPYRFVQARCVPRERFEGFPCLPGFRTESHYEEASFVPRFLRAFSPSDYDVVVTCSYPFVNWAVRLRRLGRKRPLHVFVTQNGDYPLYRKNSEYRFFDCDALVCINPDYYAAHSARWPSRLIPNGVDCSRFSPGPSERERLGLPVGVPLVLMVSALIDSKRVLEGIRAVSQVPGAYLVVAGDGPLRDEVDRLGHKLLGERFQRKALPREDMPALYRSADLFLHMSLDEPFGNVYAEALASGLPIVTHDRAVTRWMLGSYATLVDASELESVARAVEAALAQEPDREGAAAEARRRFDWKSIAREYGAFFKELVREL